MVTWDTIGQYNITYVGSNGTGCVSITWNVNVQNGSYSNYDMNQDDTINQSDLDIVWNSISTISIVSAAISIRTMMWN
jgi:hypothetical protein